MHLPHLLPSLPPSLSDRLGSQTNELLSKIVKANYLTQFARTAPELADFREATAGHIDEMDNDSLSDAFRETIHTTTYDSYAPFIEKIPQAGSCKASDIVDLLAPGLPDIISPSSSTSGGRPKMFPKYDTLPQIDSSSTGSCATTEPEAPRRRTTAFLYYLGWRRVQVLDENNCPIATIYRAAIAVVNQRVMLRVHPEEDEDRMGKFLLDHAAPHATAFIKNWPSFLLIHALFAVSSRSLETIRMLFLSTFVDMMCHLDAQFDMIVDCIASGTIPDLEGISEVRCHLEMNVSPDPERAEELRRLGRPSSRPAWCAHVWPNLRSVVGVGSGHFAVSVPLVQRMLSPDTEICSPGYGSTETMIGWPYDPLELNQFKLYDRSIFEFLDVNFESYSIGSLSQPWEIEVGKCYEIVVTTRNGLWRYRLGDVVKVCGFDPTDGFPVIQFIERRNVALRFHAFMLTEKDLRAAVSHIFPSNLANWTAVVDDRCIPPTIGFFVELADHQDIHDPSCIPALADGQCIPPPDLGLLRDRVLDELLQNKNIALDFGIGKIGKPTIRLVRAGTFSGFLQVRLDEGNGSVGQVKVPVALSKPEYVTWFSERVTQEL